MTVGEYDCTAVYPECDLTELDTNVKGVTVLLRVGTSTTTLSEVSTNCVVEVRVEIGLLRLVRGRTSRSDSSDADFGQSTSTRSEHKPLALPKVCTKHYQREYDCRNCDLIVHCTD
jgi:hypothetical protein